ncbi:MAG: hypothetical protein IH571_06285 [Acholeplasmataceae bacterium]|nr:hypothetical protein [Acholeplasmataceae bacterium]
MIKFKKLYISVLSLVFFILIFGTVTYAWVSLATINSIDGLSLTASTGEELQISVDGINYSNVLTSEQLELLFGEISLTDITSLDGIHFFNGGLKGTGPAVQNEQYLSFDLWFKTTSQQHSVYLVSNVSDKISYDTTMPGTYVVSRGVNWRSEETFQYGPDENDIVYRGDRNIYYASEAIRFSFIEIKDEENQLDSRLEDELSTWIYDPSENAERGYGLGYGAFDYYNKRIRIKLNLPHQFPSTSYRLSHFDENNPYQALDNESKIMSLVESEEKDNQERTFYKGKVRVNIWVEGWDADAFDPINNDRVKIQLQFKALNPVIE